MKQPKLRSRSRPRARMRSNRLSAALEASRDEAPEFPQAEIAMQGWMEQLLPDHSAVEIEDRYRALLKENRAAGRGRGTHA